VREIARTSENKKTASSLKPKPSPGFGVGRLDPQIDDLDRFREGVWVEPVGGVYMDKQTGPKFTLNLSFSLCSHALSHLFFTLSRCTNTTTDEHTSKFA
jgi:hypothetical protein